MHVRVGIDANKGRRLSVYGQGCGGGRLEPRSAVHEKADYQKRRGRMPY